LKLGGVPGTGEGSGAAEGKGKGAHHMLRVKERPAGLAQPMVWPPEYVSATPRAGKLTSAGIQLT